MDDLLEVADIACQSAVKAGAQSADAFVERGREVAVSVEKNAIDSTGSRMSASISVRAFAEGGTGWWSTSTTAEEAARAAGEEAARLARAAEPDPDFVSLVDPQAYPEVEGLYDDALAEVSGSEVADWITASIDEARAVDSDALVSGEAEASWREGVIVNSQGVQAVRRTTSAFVHVQVVIRRNGDVGSFYEWDSARRRADLVPAGIGAKAATEALRYLSSRSVRTATLPVVFGPLAARALFRGLCAAASAEDVQRQRSFLVGMKGERVAAEIVTLVDDPLISGGLSSGRFDDDGSPHRRVTLVEQGVLQTYLHSNYTANKSGEVNTGHATRLGIAPTNINPRLGSRSAADIISEVDDGIYVELGQPSPDTASGQISALVDAGFRIEKGELSYPLESTMVAGNAPEVLQGIDAISSDYREEPGLVLPTVRVRSMRIASGD